MLRRLKDIALFTLKTTGAYRIASGTNWRRQRLLILCYHGVSLADEHKWCPGLYLAPGVFQSRMETLERERCSVLPLGEALTRLYSGDLPPKSVAITFDDGFHDFYQLAFPILRKHGFPTTVYQTTYYTDHRFPVFNLMISYLFWRAGKRTLDGRPFGIDETFELSQSGHAVDAFDRFAFQQNYSAIEKDALAARLAGALDIDYEALRKSGILHLMSANLLAEISKAGIQVELHTHRHRTPMDRDLFLREIRDNRAAVSRYTGQTPVHFCYPSGVYRNEFLPWLDEERVASATTCECGFASTASNRLLLPRLLDTTGISQREFEGWLSGIGAFLPRRSFGHAVEVPTEYWETTSQRTSSS